MWTIKPQAIYVMGGRVKIEFRPRIMNSPGQHYTMDVTMGEVGCRVRFTSAGDVIRIEPLISEAKKIT